MIILKELNCPHCHSKAVVKNGKKHNGNQNYLCKGCNIQFQSEYLYWGADKRNQELSLKMLLRGSGVRDCSKVLGISTGAVLNCIARNADQFEIKARQTRYGKVQIDEQWSYVQNKKRKFG